ncbi:MAG: toxin [Polaromonas sp.]|nr:toxin [Polaromonas sp.]
MAESPTLADLIPQVLAAANERPIAFVLSGHNGSGKSTLWGERVAPIVQLPLINADRLITSILPAPDGDGFLEPWASNLRDSDARWQSLAQEGVTAFMGLVTEKRMAFGFETVFSHWVEQADGRIESKIDVIKSLQEKGYFVVLLFVGLVNVDMSLLRVETRITQGGHAVPRQKLLERFPRTQKAVGHASPIADMTLMFDNSRGIQQAFTLARAQQKEQVIYDCRNPAYVENDLRNIASLWLDKVCGEYVQTLPG